MHTAQRLRHAAALSMGMFLALSLVTVTPVFATGGAPVLGWGFNDQGQIGNTNWNYLNATPNPVGSLTGMSAIAAGNSHTLALTPDGKVWAVGLNFTGQLGNGRANLWTGDSNTSGGVFQTSSPAQVAGAINDVTITAISAGGSGSDYHNGHSLALDSSGHVWAWGDDTYKQLGDGGTCGYYYCSMTANPVPTQISTLSNISAIAAGGIFSMALDSSGQVWAWGSSYSSELGPDSSVGDRYPHGTPVHVTGFGGRTITAISAGPEYGLALATDGTVWAWGDNSSGQFGDGYGVGSSTATMQVLTGAGVPLTNVTAISAGGTFALALKSDSTVVAWGNGSKNQLGNGGSSNFYAAAVRNVGSGVTAIDAGYQFSLALKSDGSVWAWGNNTRYQRGTTTRNSYWLPEYDPAVVPDLSGVTAIAAGDEFALALYTPAAPTVSAISPNLGSVNGGDSIVITGTNFIGSSCPSAVTFSGVTAGSCTVDSSTQITAHAPAHSAGPTTVSVATPGGTASAVTSFTYEPVPAVSAVTPPHALMAGGISVVINGTDFSGSGFTTTAVKFGSTNATSFTVNSPTQITAISPATAAGDFHVSVTTVGGTSSNTSVDTFTALPPAPVVSALDVAAGPVAGGSTVTITGSNFSGSGFTTTALKFGTTSVDAFAISDDGTQIVATAPAHVAGQTDVTVTTSGGTSSTSSVDTFTYVSIPTVSTVSPGTALMAGHEPIVITGTDFMGAGFTASAVNFGDVPADSFTVDSATQITAVVPEISAGSADITVTTPGGVSGASSIAIVPSTPVVSALSVQYGPLGGNTSVGITGTLFAGDGFTTTAVTFGSFDAQSFTVDSPTHITAITPAESAGDVDVTVTTSGGPSNVGTFTYENAPTVTSSTAVAGPLAGGTVVTATGTSLTHTSHVTLGGTDLAFTVIDATHISFTMPSADSPVSLPVVVITPGGIADAGTFTYETAPSITSTSVAAGPLGGGTTITLVGTGFSDASAVSFGNTSVSFTIVDETHITVVSPDRSAAEIADLVVTAPGGASNTVAFAYEDPPAITDITPGTTVVGSTATVTITGTGFGDISAVTLGTTSLPFIVVDATHITVEIPASDIAATTSIIVTGPGGLSNPAQFVVAEAVISQDPPAADDTAQPATSDDSADATATAAPADNPTSDPNATSPTPTSGTTIQPALQTESARQSFVPWPIVLPPTVLGFVGGLAVVRRRRPGFRD